MNKSEGVGAAAHLEFVKREFLEGKRAFIEPTFGLGDYPKEAPLGLLRRFPRDIHTSAPLSNA
jgi:hypothetical protein